MEEASIDQGLDRLPFFFGTILLFALAIAPARATTFGPISPVEQMRRSQYFVHGRITSPPWVEMERRVQRPFTHWKLRVSSQPVGESLGEEITIRQPGGEIGEMGYFVAGSAKFQEGEEVFVTVRDTEENGVKEVVGLASGKYSVVPGADGRPIVRSGLGITLRGPGGKPLSPKEFLELAERVARGQETEEDRKLMVNQRPVHDHDPVLEQRTAEAKALQNQGTMTAPANTHGGVHETAQDLNSVQESRQISEEPKKGSGDWWIPVGIAVLALAAGLILFKR